MLQTPSRSTFQPQAASQYFSQQYVKTSNNPKTANFYGSLMSAASVSTTADLRKSAQSNRFSTEQQMNRSASSLLSSPVKGFRCETFTPRSPVGKILKTTNKGFNESEVNNVNKLLEEGYTVVSTRQDLKEKLKGDQSGANEKIQKVNKEILVEQQRATVLKETLMESQGVQAKYREEIDLINGEIREIKKVIENRKKEYRQREYGMENVIGKIGQEINQVKASTASGYNTEKQEVEALRKKLEKVEREEWTCNEELRNLKKQLQEVKAQQSLKKKTMEEKSRVFLGTLQGK